MHPRGYTLLELIVVIILIGLVSAGAGTAYVAMGRNVDIADARNTVSVALAAQHQRYSSRGAFTAQLERLEQISPEITHVDVANTNDEVSSAVGDLDGVPAVAATTRHDDVCVAGIAVDPSADEEIEGVSWTRTPAERCTGEEAFNHIGEGTW